MIKPFTWKPCRYFFLQPTWYGALHLGQDFSISYEPIYAHTDGKIVQSGHGKQIGNFVIIKDSNGKYVRHGHLSRIVVGKGDVKEGQLIAVSGNTGLSKGPHVHTDVWNVPFGVGYGRVVKGDYSVLIDPLRYFIDDNKTPMEKIEEKAKGEFNNPRAFIVIVDDSKGEQWFIKDDKKEKINTEKAMGEAEASAYPQKTFVAWAWIAELPEAKMLHNN